MSAKMSFYRTSHADLHVGDVVRHSGVEFKFQDSIILGFTDPDKWGDIYVKLARPYARTFCEGTTSPTALCGMEIYTVTVTKILEDKIFPGGRERENENEQ